MIQTLTTTEALNHLFDLHPGFEDEVHQNLQDPIYQTPRLQDVKTFYDGLFANRRNQRALAEPGQV